MLTRLKRESQSVLFSPPHEVNASDLVFLLAFAGTENGINEEEEKNMYSTNVL